MYRKTNTRRVAGFTLIEIMVVVVIIGFIGTLGSLAVINRLRKASIDTTHSFIKGPLSQSLEMYYTDNNIYPSTEQGIDALMKKPSGSPTPRSWDGPYLNEEPVDPWGGKYQYRFPSENGREFDLWSNGPDGIEGSEDDITNWKKDSE